MLVHAKVRDDLFSLSSNVIYIYIYSTVEDSVQQNRSHFKESLS